jgi:radical SAM superfamily enzyme YgiQ (UPF0313 family)
MYSKVQLPFVPVCGIGYLSEYLSYHGIDNDVIDLGLNYKGDISAPVSLLRQRIEEVKPDLIGFQVMTYRRDITCKIIDEIKSPDYDIVIGGVYVSTVRAQVMDEFQVDFAVKLEGELPLLELCQGKDLDQIDSLMFRDSDHVIENRDRPFSTDLDSFPFPKYTKFELDKYSLRVMPLIASRGCPYGCIYCANPPTMGRRFRARSAENVIQELKYWYERGYREFDFNDDVFSLQKDRVYQICDLIEQHGLRHLTLQCTNGLRADLVDRALLKRMKEVGFYMINIGVEVGNDRMLRVIKKGEIIEQIDEAVKIACELGYNVGICFTIGQPGETEADVRDSFNFALKHPVAWANFYNIVPYPRTELYDWIEKNKYFVGDIHERLKYDGVFDQPFFVTPELPLEKRKELLEDGAKVGNEVRKRAMLKTLKKSGPFGFLFAAIIYNERLHPFIVRLYHGNRTVNRLVNWLVERGIIKVRHL